MLTVIQACEVSQLFAMQHCCGHREPIHVHENKWDTFYDTMMHLFNHGMHNRESEPWTYDDDGGAASSFVTNVLV